MNNESVSWLVFISDLRRLQNYQVGGLGANIPTKLNIFVFLTKTNPLASWNGAFSSVIIALH